MGMSDVFLKKRRVMTIVLTETTSLLWFFVLLLQPEFTRSFIDMAGRGSIVLPRMSMRISMETETYITDAPAEVTKNPCFDVDDNEALEEDNDFSLLCPSSYPSKTFAASNLEVSYHPIESDDVNGNRKLQLLPLQKYHARAKKRRRRKMRGNTGHDGVDENLLNDNFAETVHKSDISLLAGKTSAVRHDIPSLDFIYENLSRFPITISSQVLLEEYHAHKQSCCIEADPSGNSSPFPSSDASDREKQQKLIKLLEGRLRSKIRAECRASLPLSAEDTLEMLFCDSHICVVNKPSGVLSVPGHKRNPSLANLVYDTIQPSSVSTFDDGSIDNIDQSVVHRLDMATSGIIIYALSKRALQELHVTFRERRVQKTYQALVEGHLLPDGGVIEGEIDVALERDPTNPPYMRVAQPRRPPREDDTNSISNKTADATTDNNPQKVHKFWREAPKPSKTTWSILGYERDPEGNPLTRVELKPHTGRTHQLRVHTSGVLCTPIVGDDIYGSGNHDPNDIMCLHAQKLCIHHPITGSPMIFEADPPF